MTLTLSRPREAHFRHIQVITTTRIGTTEGRRSGRRLPDLGRTVNARPAALEDDIVHEWGMQSFPASDPPANW